MAKTQSNTQETAPEASKGTVKAFINIDTPDEEVVRSIQNGEFLVFEHEKGRFKVLSQDVIDMMDPITKGSYRASEALNAKHDPEADEFAKRFQVIGSGAPQAGPMERFENVDLKGDLAKTWARPDMHQSMLDKGWVPAKNGVHVGSHLASNVEGHIEVKTGLGVTDSILYVKDAAAHKADRAKRVNDRLALGKQLEEFGREAVLGTGYKPVKSD